MLVRRKKPAWFHANRTAVEVVNISSGHTFPMLDDGVNEAGEPVRGRVHLIKKLSMRDEAGDPLFALGECVGEGDAARYVFNGFPDHMRKWDSGGAIKWPLFSDDEEQQVEKARPESNVKVCSLAGRMDQMSNDPAFKGKTLGEKTLANRRAHEASEVALREEHARRSTPSMNMPPELVAMTKSLAVLADQAARNNPKGPKATPGSAS